MLKPGTYHASNDESIWDAYDIEMEVKETEKSYIFTMKKFESKYGATQMESLFRDKKRIVIRKNKCGHAMRVWGDHDFTFYPYQAGVPYSFTRMEPEEDDFSDIDPERVRQRLAEVGIVNGELVDPEKLEKSPFIQQVVSDVERLIAREGTPC